jgi:Fur family ferric uptake transcriptional regulator
MISHTILPLAMPSSFELGSVQVALSPQERFDEFLQTRGKRNTQQRRVIVEQVFRRHEHFEAEELLAQLAKLKVGPKIGRATVYRTLGELVDAGLLVKMDISGRAVYEHDYGYPSHDHLHCQKCGKLFEFHSAELERIRDAVARELGFRVTEHRMIISGTCSDCQQKDRRGVRRLELI